MPTSGTERVRTPRVAAVPKVTGQAVYRGVVIEAVNCLGKRALGLYRASGFLMAAEGL